MIKICLWDLGGGIKSKDHYRGEWKSEWNAGWERLCEGQELINMEKLNHRGTHFPVDEDTNNFDIKEDRD